MTHDYWTAGAEIEKRDMEIAALKARLAEAEREISRLREITDCCEWCSQYAQIEFGTASQPTDRETGGL